MKPYIMLYSETTPIISSGEITIESTTKTFSVETNDDDYINLKDWTTITKTNETIDEDYIYSPINNFSKNDFAHTSTIITRSLENDDTDYFQASTIRTNTIESSDDDYIDLM